MKYSLMIAFSLLCAFASGQGLVNFNNRVTSGSGAQGPVVAPVFVIGVGDEWPKYGNPATYPETPIPAGTQTYYGSPAVGTGFTAQLWAAKSTDPDSAMAPIATTTFRDTTNPSLMGFWQPPGVPPAVPGVRGGTDDRAKFQVRAWDNHGGTLTTWQQVLQANTTILGWSQVFTVPFPLGDGVSISPPTLQGLESFLIGTDNFVPEPTTIGILTLATVLGLLRVRMRNRLRK